MKKIGLLAICVFASYTLHAYNLRRISKYDGLSNSAIQTMCRDSDGLMWFGSVDGLNLYDGCTLRPYPFDGGEALSGNLIEDMIETRPGVFWIQTSYGLDRFDKHLLRVEHHYTYASNYRLRSGGDVELLFVKDGGGEAEAVYYNDVASSFGHIQLPGIEYRDVLDYFLTDDNTLWLSCLEGRFMAFSLVRDVNGSFRATPSDDSFSHSLPVHYAFHEGTTIYTIDGTGALWEYDTGTKTGYYVADISSETKLRGAVSSIVKSGDDYFVGFQTDGLVCIRHTPDNPERNRTEQIYVRAGVFCLLKDRYQDIVWIGTDGQGVYIYSNDSCSVKSVTYENFTLRINKPARAMLLDNERSLWVATKGDGLFRILDYDLNRDVAQHRVEYFDTRNSPLGSNSVYALSRSRQGVLWIGGDEGIDWFDYASGRIRHLEVSIDGEPLRWVHGMEQSDDNTLWVATVGAGMVRVDVSWSGHTPRALSAERFTTGDGGMSDNYFFTVYGGSPGSIWFGNRGRGACCLDLATGGFETIRFDDPHANRAVNDIFCIMRGEGDRMWFGTSAGLIKRDSDGEYTIYGCNVGFPNGTIHGMLSGRRGDIWLSTNSGIIRFDPDAETFATYSHNAPTDVVEFSDGAFFRSESEGILFFGGINGFTAIRENDYPPAGYVPPIVPGRMTIFGEEHNIYDHLLEQKGSDPLLDLSWRENFFSLSLTVVDYMYGHNYTYKYCLEGMSGTWIDNGTDGTVYFTNIAPGRYTLRMQGINPETGVEAGEFTATIRIRPPWYTSRVACALWFLVGLALIWSVARYFVARNEQKRKAALDILREEHEKEVYESKLRFFTNIAHEFCTPLTLIHGPCERILVHTGSDPFVLRNASRIRRNADRMNDLIRELIEFRRIETGNRTPCITPVDVSELMSALFDNFTDLAESQGFIYTSGIEPGIVWNSDRDFLTTITSNLISNALKYTNRNGSISVSLTVDGKRLRLDVMNTGKGIRAENIERLFDRYSILDDFENRGDRSQTRNGLGLAISYNMIQLLGGEIEVDSERGVETRFTIHLPEAEPTSVATIVSSVPLMATTPAGECLTETDMPEYVHDERKPTIMIVDDERDMLWLAVDIFASEYNVIPVDDPAKVADHLLQVVPSVIICDVMMPGLDGISLVGHLRADSRTAHVPLILLSAKHEVGEQIEGLEAGADIYITKPFNIDYLKTSVRRLISRKETLKEYFASPISAYELSGGRLTHIDHRRFVQQILDIITDNLGNRELSAQFIADRMNISARCLYRKLREMDAPSPLHMIRESRLHIARDMLLNTTMTIDEIIYKSGFSNRSPFFNAFSEKFACTPREYRQRHTKGLR